MFFLLNVTYYTNFTTAKIRITDDKSNNNYYEVYAWLKIN